MKELDSNNLKTTIHKVCRECWIEASELTWKKKFPNEKEPERYCFSVSTFRKNTCDFCGEIKSVTETRDFFYPDFNLLKKKQWNLKTNK